MQNKIEQIKQKTNLLNYELEESKNRQNLLEKRLSLSQKGLNKIARMQNLSQTELEQITKMQNQSWDKLEQIAKMRRIKNYKNMSKEKLLIAHIKSEQSLDEVYNKAEENKVEEPKEYPDRYDPDYKVIWDVKNLFDEINEDYYEPVKTKIAFNVNYIEYESKGDRDKNLSPQEYLNMIRACLRDLINNHKASLDGSLGNNLHGE